MSRSWIKSKLKHNGLITHTEKYKPQTNQTKKQAKKINLETQFDFKMPFVLLFILLWKPGLSEVNAGLLLHSSEQGLQLWFLQPALLPAWEKSHQGFLSQFPHWWDALCLSLKKKDKIAWKKQLLRLWSLTVYLIRDERVTTVGSKSTSLISLLN